MLHTAKLPSHKKQTPFYSCQWGHKFSTRLKIECGFPLMAWKHKIQVHEHMVALLNTELTPNSWEGLATLSPSVLPTFCVSLCSSKNFPVLPWWVSPFPFQAGDSRWCHGVPGPGWLIASPFSCSDKHRSPAFKESIIQLYELKPCMD